MQHSKCCVGKPTVGSNPTSTASYATGFPVGATGKVSEIPSRVRRASAPLPKEGAQKVLDTCFVYAANYFN